MKVILQKDVKDLGKVGDLVSVSDGFARNLLFPRKLAVQATEGRKKEWEHLQKVAEVQKKKAKAARQELVEKLSGVTVTFKVAAGEEEKLFGSVTNADISEELAKSGYEVDRRDIHLDEPIKVLGQHKATVKLGQGLEAEVSVMVEKA
ncbi:MAG: 50S ribosomal protein L9 [Bdellovibrionales bacterium]|nr:50S ribosomal protein L9 [Bdellovibrionales bacterium]